MQHSKKKRLFAERYAMTNVMKAEPLEAINERAKIFVSKCAEAGRKSVDVYVRFLQSRLYILLDSCLLALSGTPSLLCRRLCHAFHVQPRRPQIARHEEGL